MEGPERERPLFKDFITLNKKMTPQEAISTIADFQDKQSTYIVGMFPNLGNFNRGTIKFERGVNNSANCINMVGVHLNGNMAWWQPLNDGSGYPMARIG